MTHWAEQLIGRPWEYGAQGPDKFDCWGLTRFVQRMSYGRDLPAVQAPTSWNEARRTVDTYRTSLGWAESASPSDGAIVLMARTSRPVHVGVCVQAGRSLGVLHCVQGSGVLFQNFNALRIAGWGSLRYYVHP